jgi:hypothetical protein
MTKPARTPPLEISSGIDHRRITVISATSSAKVNRRRMSARRRMIVAVLFIIAGLECDLGYRHFSIDSAERIDIAPGKIGDVIAAPFTGYTDAFWVNGWSGPHFDR